MPKLRLKLEKGKIVSQEVLADKKPGKIERAGKKIQRMWDDLNAPIEWPKHNA